MNDYQKPRVLAVDDDEVLSSFIGSILSPQGILVRTLKEPIHILDCLKEVEPSLVILDVMMPGLSGYDVARLLRSEPKWKDLSILFLTSKSTAEGRAAAFNAGADDFLSKPVLTEELITRVKNQLDRKTAIKERLETDERTECMTRNYFLKYLGEDLEAKNNKSGCLALIEIDRFEQIGITHGVFAGDDVISTIGKRIKNRFRADVKRARWGEKTFALLFSGTNQEESTQAVRVLRREIEEMTFQSEKGGDFKVTCTYASAELPKESDSLNGIVDLVQSRLLEKTKSKEEPVSKS
jgi:diguanylate cyclase (GGDEF)-like protein